MPGFLPPVVLELRAKAHELHAEAAATRAELTELATSTEASSARMQTAFRAAGAAGKLVTVGVLGAAAVIGGFSIEAAQAAQVVDAKLATAVKNAGGSMEELEPKIKKSDAAMRNYGFTNEDTNTALATLTTALKDPKKAMDDLSVAANLARTKNIDLNAAALLVAKTSEGQSRGLKQLGIDLPVASANAAQVAAAQQKLAAAQDKANKIISDTPRAANASSKAHKQYEAALTAVKNAQDALTAKQSAGGVMLDALKQRVNGAASAYGNTLQGQLKKAAAGIQDIGETIGKALIPYVTRMVKGAMEMAHWLGQNKGVLIGVGVALGVVAGTLMAVYIAQKLYIAGLGIAKAAVAVATAAQWLFNAAMDANPVGLIILALVALVAIIILVITHWKEVSSFLTTVWKHVADFFVTVGTAIWKWWNGFWSAIVNFAITIFRSYVGIYITIFTALWNGLVAIGTAIAAWWNGLWSGITGFVQRVWSAGVKIITDGFQWLYSTLIGTGVALINWWNGLWSGIAGFVSSVWKGAGNAIITFINSVIDAVNGLIGGINTVLAALKTASGGTIDLKLGKIPHLPHFDVGTPAVPGAPGAPIVAVVHGGEPILSNDQMAGRARIPGNVVSAVNRQEGHSATGAPSVQSKHLEVNATFNTNASPVRIQAELGWLVKRKG